MKLSPALAYLAASPWAMEFAVFARLAALVEAHAAGDRADPATVAALRDGQSAAPGELGTTWQGRTAIVPIRGVIARYASSVNGVCQPQGRSAESIQSDLMAAVERGAERIILRIDSPGGEVAGTAETAAMVRYISARGIPIVAYIDGLAASAAYWIASQASEIVASSDTAKGGSLGVAMPVAGGGGSYTVITSAPAKAGGAQGAAHLANARQIVADLATAFVDAVAAGRGLSAAAAAALATGEVWTARRAIDLGLIDRIASWDQVLGKVADAADPTADPDRRRAIAERLAATITVSQPASRSAPAAESPSTPAAAQAATSSGGSDMDTKLKAKLAALCQQHPTHAAALVAAAMADGATEASLQAKADALVAAAQDAAHAAEVAALKTAHAAEVAALKTDLAGATKRAADEKARADQAQARADHRGADDPGADDAAAAGKTRIPLARAASLTPAEQAAIIAGTAVFVADKPTT